MFLTCMPSHVCFLFFFFQIVEARGALMQKLQEKRDCQVEECDQPRPDQEHRDDSVTGRGFTPSEENNTSTEKNDVAKGVQIDDTVSTENWLEEKH